MGKYSVVDGVEEAFPAFFDLRWWCRTWDFHRRGPGGGAVVDVVLVELGKWPKDDDVADDDAVAGGVKVAETWKDHRPQYKEWNTWNKAFA